MKASAKRRARRPVIIGTYSTEDIRRLIREECDYEGSMRAFARLIDVTAGHISRVLRGEKEPGPKLLEWLGFEAITLYRAKSQSSFVPSQVHGSE